MLKAPISTYPFAMGCCLESVRSWDIKVIKVVKENCKIVFILELIS